MIQQTSLVIHNGCQHEDLEFRFSPGMMALTGPNACGKTNVIQLNIYGLTGVVDKSWGSQKDFNRTGTTDGYVVVTLLDTLSKKSIIVRRNFTTGAKYPDKLWLENDQHEPDIVGREKVNLYLSSVLFGSSCSMLSDLLWLKQGQITWLLTANATSVYNFFNSIFDTSKIRQIRDVLMDVIGRIGFYKTDPADIARCTTDIARYKETLSTLSADDFKKQLALLQDTQKKLYGTASGTISQGDKDSKISVLNQKITATKDFIASICSDIQTFDVPPCPWVTAEHVDFVSKYDRVRSDMAECVRRVSGLESGISLAAMCISDAEREIARIRADKDNLSATVEAVTSSTVCPLCSGKIEDHDGYVSNAYKLFSLNDKMEQFDASLMNLTAMITDEAPKLSEAQADKDGLTASIRDMTAFLQNGLEAYNTISEAINRNNLWKAAPRDIEVLQRRRNDLTSNLEDYEKQLSDTRNIPVRSSDLASEITDVDNRIREVQQHISSIEADIKSAEVCLKSSEEALDKLNRVQAENSNAQNWYDILVAVRESTHNTRIPSRYLFDKVDLLNKEMSVYCSMSGLAYTVFLDHEDFTFKFSSNGHIRNAGQLSGAQKTLCAIILQLALIRVVHPMLSVIMADEPTVFLDDENRGKLILLFQNMRGILSSSGTVFIIPTHDTDIISSCDGVFNLTRKD